MFYLPTKEECDYIVENSKQFFRKDLIFKEKEIAIYHYKQGEYEEFKKFNAWELRALTFIKNENKWERFLGIHKFFELNQAPGWMEEDLINKKVLKVSEKIDGTFVHPVLINNKVYFKSKLRFDSLQALKAQEIYEKNENLKQYVNKKLNEGKIPLFEYISPKTQIVMNYNKEKLILVQVRDLNTGMYELNFEKEAKEFNIDYAPVCEAKPLKDYLEEKNVCSSKEGWVMIFEGMQFVKVKTNEYLKRHKILGDLRENIIISHILDNSLNEIKNILSKESEKYQFIKEIENKFNKNYSRLEKNIKEALKMTNKEMKKRFLNDKNYEVIAMCKKKNSIKPLKTWIKEHTKKLKNAKKFLE